MLLCFKDEINDFEIKFSREVKALRSKILLLKIIHKNKIYSLSEILNFAKISGAHYFVRICAVIINFIPHWLLLFVIKIKGKFEFFKNFDSLCKSCSNGSATLFLLFN